MRARERILSAEVKGMMAEAGCTQARAGDRLAALSVAIRGSFGIRPYDLVDKYGLECSPFLGVACRSLTELRAVDGSPFIASAIRSSWREERRMGTLRIISQGRRPPQEPERRVQFAP